MAEKTHYSDEELLEFKELILKKLELARKDYSQSKKGQSLLRMARRNSRRWSGMRL